MTPSTETWLISTISKRLERIAEGKEPMAEDRALTLLSILKDVAGDIPSLTNLPQHVKEWLEAAVNARLDAIAEKREIAAEDRIATLTEALAALRPPALPGGAVELVDTGAGLSGGPITTTGTISLSTSSQQAIARANTSVQPGDLAAVATSGNYADLTNTPTIPEQFNPVQGANMLITGTYPNITFSAVAGEEFTPVWGEIQGTLADQTDLQAALDGKAPAVHQHNASDINAGTLANARISQGSVTQHQAALSIGWSQLSGLPAFATRWPTWGEVTGKPSIPTSADYVATSGNQSDLSGNKEWTGTHTFYGARADGEVALRIGIEREWTIGQRGTGGSSHLLFKAEVGGDKRAVFEDSTGAGSIELVPYSSRIYIGGNEAWHAGNLTPSNYAPTSRSISAGDGLSGGGNFTANRTITLGTPGTLSGSTTNAVTTSSHTHALSANLTAWDGVTVASKADSARTLTAGNGLSGGGNLTANRTITLGTPSTLSGSTTNSVTSGSHTHALSTNLSAWDGHHPDNAWVNKGNIPGEQNLNTYQTTGVYHQNANADATSGTNYPTNLAGMLVVYSSGNMTYQTYQVYNSGDVWTRSRYNTSWSAWKLSVDGTTTITAGNGLTGGGNLTANRTITLGTPGQITATSTNSVTSTSHTHALNTTGDFTWTGNNTFTGGMIARRSSASNQITIERTGNSINAAAAYTTTGGTVYAGQGDNGYFNWGTNADLRYSHADTWGRIGSSGLEVKGTVASSNALLRGGASAAIFSFEGTTTGSTLYFRPRGTNSSTNQTTIDWNGNMTVNGTITGTNATATSDPRLKDNIKKVKARRELIEKLEYFSFKWKKDGVAGRSIMADKVQEIAPEHVHVADDEMGTLSVDKGALALEMVFALIDVLKEQEFIEGD